MSELIEGPTFSSVALFTKSFQIYSSYKCCSAECPKFLTDTIVLDLESQVRNVVLMNVYLGLGNSGGLGFWNEGYMSQGREMGS
jgi:hypothetical protein